MAEGDEINPGFQGQRSLKMADARATSTDGTWIPMGAYRVAVSAHVKGSSYTGTWEIYASNDLSDAVTGGVKVAEGDSTVSSVDQVVTLPSAAQYRLKTTRTAGSVTAIISGVRG